MNTIFLIILLIVPLQANIQCYVKDYKTGEIYDFSKLANNKKSYSVKERVGEGLYYDHYVTPCATTPYNKNTDCTSRTSPAIRIFHGLNLCAAWLGDLSYQSWEINDTMITLSYTRGEICLGEKRNQISINFYCDPKTESDLFMVKRVADCEYSMIWFTKYACKKSELLLVNN
jgi:hypothetical protein